MYKNKPIYKCDPIITKSKQNIISPSPNNFGEGWDEVKKVTLRFVGAIQNKSQN